jgi:hypothetical protein
MILFGEILHKWWTKKAIYELLKEAIKVELHGPIGH